MPTARTPTKRVVARIIEDSPLGDEFRTIVCSHPSADQPQVRHVKDNRTPVVALKGPECSLQRQGTTGTRLRALVCVKNTPPEP